MDKNPPYKRIATEEAWAPPDLLDRYRKAMADGSVDDPGFRSLWGFFAGPSPRAQALFDRIQDLGAGRLADMDATGIDMQVVAVTSPGVQMFAPDLATGLARELNDRLVEEIGRNPTRFAGLASIAPQEPAKAAREIERAVGTLGLKGVMINSHTRGEYLDDPKFWDILAAAEALDAPIYLHPNTPSPGLIQPFLDRGLDGAVFGFAVETGLHAMRMIVAGVFDRFPRLQVVLGHLGEALPYWMWRFDFMHGIIARTGRYGDRAPPLQKPVSAYLRENFHYTSSGMAWAPPILYVREVIGMERLLYAMDYPYQWAAEEVEAQDALPLSPEDKFQFFQGNAERLFKLARG